jgi:hypothetical protein
MNNMPTNGEHRLLEAVIRVESMGTDISDIKKSVRDMALAITRLAVFEERQTHDRSEITRVIKELGEHDRRIDTLELAQPLLALTTSWVQKAVWLVVGAVIAAVLALVVISRGSDVVSQTTSRTTTETIK